MLSVALLARFAWHRPDLADAMEVAVERTLAAGWRTPDLPLFGSEKKTCGTQEMAEAVLSNFRAAVL
jgi:hypothetical protein